MRWYENVIDGGSLEIENNEMYNGWIGAADFDELEMNFCDAFDKEFRLFGIAMTAPRLPRLASILDETEYGAVVFVDGNGTRWWVHINLARLKSMLEKVSFGQIPTVW